MYIEQQLKYGMSLLYMNRVKYICLCDMKISIGFLEIFYFNI